MILLFRHDVKKKLKLKFQRQDLNTFEISSVLAKVDCLLFESRIRKSAYSFFFFLAES